MSKITRVVVKPTRNNYAEQYIGVVRICDHLLRPLKEIYRSEPFCDLGELRLFLKKEIEESGFELKAVRDYFENDSITAEEARKMVVWSPIALKKS